MSVISVNPIYPDIENMFPTAVDVIPRFIEPALEDLQIINRFYNYINSENKIAADALLVANPRLQQMCINANSLNPLVDAIISMQRYYLNDVQRYLVNIVKSKGDWNSSARYTKYDVVQYVNNGAIESYMGMVEVIPIGTLPTDLDYFTPLTLRGEQGTSGTGLSPRGAWNSIIQYYKDDCVSYSNVLWAAKVDNVNKAPQDISDSWEPVLRVPKQIVFSSTEPVGQMANEIWFKELGANACEIYQKQSNGTYKLILVNANNALTANSALTANKALSADNATNSVNAQIAQKLKTARTINGVAFDGSANITVTSAANGGTSAACSGNATTATRLQTARTINGVLFDGSSNITLSAAANGGNADTVDGFGFNNTGVGGTPAFVPGWAGGSPTNMDMFKPSEWNVNYANSSNSANSAGYATNAGSASNADTVDQYHFWTGTLAQYNAISKSNNTFYMIVG